MFGKENDNYGMYIESVIKKLKQCGIAVRESCAGIYVNNGIDEWLIDIRSADSPNKAQVKLFHQNVLIRAYQPKGKRIGGVKDMHLQFIKSITDQDLVDYIVKHAGKYKKL